MLLDLVYSPYYSHLPNNYLAHLTYLTPYYLTYLTFLTQLTYITTHYLTHQAWRCYAMHNCMHCVMHCVMHYVVSQACGLARPPHVVLCADCVYGVDEGVWAALVRRGQSVVCGAQSVQVVYDLQSVASGVQSVVSSVQSVARGVRAHTAVRVSFSQLYSLRAVLSRSYR